MDGGKIPRMAVISPVKAGRMGVAKPPRKLRGLRVYGDKDNTDGPKPASERLRRKGRTREIVAARVGVKDLKTETNQIKETFKIVRWYWGARLSLRRHPSNRRARLGK